MKQYLLILLFLSQIGNSQNSELKKLLFEGEKAFSENNFLLAKEIYTKVAKIDSNNRDYWYNLAASELYLGEKDIACLHFYKVYLLGDINILRDIKEYCPNFKNGTIQFMEDVEEKPKFSYEGTEHLLFEGNNLNSTYQKILLTEVKKSKIIKAKVKGKIFVEMQISKFGAFEGRVTRIEADKNDVEIVKNEVLSILRNLVTYIPAKHKGMNVDLWEKWTIPLIF